MNTYHSYEDMWRMQTPPARDVLEAYSGVSIVRWASGIRYRLQRMIDEQEANRNNEYADLLRTFLNTWTANQITGSINRETLEVLKAAAEPLAVMKWAPSSYFQGLTTSLDELIADQEQLPSGVPTDQNAQFTGGAGFSAPPLGGDFGPEEEGPPGQGSEEPPPGPEGPGAPSAEGQPGAEEQQIPTQ